MGERGKKERHNGKIKEIRKWKDKGNQKTKQQQKQKGK